LDIGTNLGFFSFRLAYEFDCSAVMVERKGVFLDKLLEVIARQDKRDHLTLLSGDLNLAILNQLGTCEHFDVVLALRVVHHFKEPYSQVINAMANLGDHLFLELPTKDEQDVCQRERITAEMSDHEALLAHLPHEKIGEYAIHVGDSMSPMDLVNKPKSALTRPFMGSTQERSHQIFSNFTEKRIVKANDEAARGGTIKREWIPAINLFTYHMLQGVHPCRYDLAHRIENYAPPHPEVTDIRPWNFLLSGTQPVMIDYDSPKTPSGGDFKPEDPKTNLRRVAFFILLGVRHCDQFTRIPALGKAALKLRLAIRMIRKGLGNALRILGEHFRQAWKILVF
ncbi:MAG: hypothetical protein AB7E32_15260, partial [Desulfovibrio sp.]